MDKVIQPSFSAGEMSPSLYGRVDLAKYRIGCATMRNFYVDYRGGASNRPGTRFVGRAFRSYSKVRLIPFQFSTVQTYILEFGDFYMRVIKNGAHVLENNVTISGVTNANPGVVTANAHGYANGDWVYISGVNGVTGLNGNTYVVAGATTNTFQLTDFDGNNVSTVGLGSYTSGGTGARYYTLVTPWGGSDLAMLKYTQSADVMTIVHPSYPPRDLTRTGNAAWTLTTISFGSTISAPTISAVSPSGAGTTGVGFVVTAVDANGQESVGSTMFVNNACNNYTTSAGYVQVAWNVVSGAVAYNVYRTLIANNASIVPGANVGFVGTAYSNSFNDGNIIPDFTKTPPLHVDPFVLNYPGAVAYFQQRKWYGGTLNFPETLYATKVGAFKNMDYSNPTVASDSLNLTLASLQVNNIKYMIGMPGGLVVLTGNGAWQINGGSKGDAVTPTSAQATPQAYSGCADLPPLLINYDILYVQSKGSIVRDLSYNFYVNVYTGTDLTVLSNHLFNPHSLTEWCWAEEPFKLVWAVRDDGVLLSCTFLKEQEVLGWARHDTQGLFKSVATIQEGQEDAVYVVVQRYIKGKWVQYVERFVSRIFPNDTDNCPAGIVENSWFVDCGLDYPLVYPAAGLTLSGASGAVTATADAAVFAPGDVGKVLRGAGGIATVTSYTSSTVVGVTWGALTTPTNLIANDPNNVPVPLTSGQWSLTPTTSVVTGLSHLEGKTVKVLGDGSTFPDKTVVGGSITLDQPCSRIIVGLGYTSQLQTLDLEGGQSTLQGKFKSLSELNIKVQNTRGIKYGPKFSMLAEVKQRGPDTYMGSPISLLTGQFNVTMDPLWGVEGRICIQQDYPLPVTILSVAPDVMVGSNEH